MTKLTEKVQMILENWSGEDDAGRRTPTQVAQEIDEEMQQYLESLPKQTRVILEGKKADKRRVA